MKKDFSHKTILHLLMIAVAGVLIYSNTFNAHFELDDDVYIVQNAAIKDLGYFLEPSRVLGLTEIAVNFRYAFITRIAGYFTLALNYHIHGLDVTGYHVFNLLIHIINALLVYFLIRLVFQTPFFSGGMRGNSGSPLSAPGAFALCCALFFVSHPLQTQAVTYISQRFASLAALFYLLSILAYIKSRLSGPSPLIYGLYALSFMSAVIAMLVKEISFTLPLMIALFELLFFSGKSLRRALLVAPFALTMLVVPAALMTAQGSFSIDGLKQSMETLASGPSISRLDYLFTQFRVIVTYIRLLFLPVNQNLDYDYPVYHSFFALPVLCSFLLLLLVFSLGIYFLFLSGKKDREGRHCLRLISLGVLWFFITISIESSIIPIQDVIFEHRAYLPSAGFFVAAVAVIAMLLRKARSAYVSKAAAAGIACAICVLGVAAFARNGIWKTNVSLWEDVVRKSPSKARPHYNLGVAYTTQGRDEEAIREFRAAVKANPGYYEAHFNLAKAFTRQGRVPDAISAFQAAIRINPGDADVHYNLGLAYSSLGDIAAAIREYRFAITLAPGHFMAHNNLANAYLSLGRTEDAIRAYLRAIQTAPGYAVMHYNLGLAYAAEGRTSDAVKEFEAVLRLQPDHENAKKELMSLRGMIK